MSLMSEFKQFALRGNVMDLAVGVIIGAAFGKIVDSMVNDVIMPVIAALLGGRVDFSSMLVPLGKVPEGTAMTLDALKKAGVPVFAYGSFITAVINFLIIAFVVFLLVKGVNRIKDAAMRKQVAESSAAGPSTEALLAEIRDLLAARPPAGR